MPRLSDEEINNRVREAMTPSKGTTSELLDKLRQAALKAGEKRSSKQEQ